MHFIFEHRFAIGFIHSYAWISMPCDHTHRHSIVVVTHWYALPKLCILRWTVPSGDFEITLYKSAAIRQFCGDGPTWFLVKINWKSQKKITNIKIVQNPNSFSALIGFDCKTIFLRTCGQCLLIFYILNLSHTYPILRRKKMHFRTELRGVIFVVVISWIHEFNWH